jgi:protein tyrosine phosphatase (PTP) superfamily phosphohydrolase (DUF442 family)
VLRSAGTVALLVCVASASTGVIAVTSGAATEVAPAAAAPAPIAPAASPAKGHGASDHAAPIHNYKRLSARIVRGAQPMGERDFAFLAAEGVRTIVTVDGAQPDVEGARRHGLRYVHLPIGYDGIPADKAAALVTAFRTLEGPFFVHCHHGKHRGPAACALGRMAIEGVGAAEAVAEMREAGTDPKYRGLYAVPASYREPTAEELAAVGPLPERAPVPGLRAAMVALDDHWDRMKAVKKAGWKVPADHPDVDPAHEATMIAELFRELARSEATRPRPFLDGTATSEKAAWDLGAALREGRPADAAKAFEAIQASCTSCHAAFRDNK